MGSDPSGLRRHLVRDCDSGDLIARVLAFLGTSHIRVVFEHDLERRGATFHREEATALRDALTSALCELDEWRSEPETPEPLIEEPLDRRPLGRGSLAMPDPPEEIWEGTPE